jgi:hypothetical protein
MRSRLLIAVLAAAGALAVPATASAALTVGIAENQPAMFSDPLFQQLGAKHTRVVMSWNVMTSGDDELARVTQYLETANAQGIEPLVTFEHTRGDASRCKSRDRRKPVCKLPSGSDYERNLELFFARFPFVKVVAPWNEANHFTQPTWRNARTAARFTKIARRECGSGCKIVEMDILDQADKTTARRPTFRKTVRYIKSFRRALGRRPRICGIHNYSDVNRFRSTGTTAMTRAMGCREIWLTETGGLYDFGSFWTRKTRKGCRSAEACQLKATKYMFTQARRNRRIKRLYVYTWFGDVTPRFDAGIVANGQPRDAYDEIAKRF